jgi:hypothetical protein
MVKFPVLILFLKASHSRRHTLMSCYRLGGVTGSHKSLIISSHTKVTEIPRGIRILEKEVKVSYRYCRVTKVYKQGDIVRTVGVKFGARGPGWKCKEMTVGVQRLTLVTPAENVQGELAAHANPVSVNNDELEESVDMTEVVTEGEDESCIDEKEVTCRELKNLEVPSWMRPASESRSCFMSIVNHSTLQGLNMGLWVE